MAATAASICCWSAPTKGCATSRSRTCISRGGTAWPSFPNSVTERGTKHLAEMSDMVREGHRAVMVYLIQRSDAKRLAFARDVDPIYGAAYDSAVAAGVEAIALRCRMGTDEIVVDKPVPIAG